MRSLTCLLFGAIATAGCGDDADFHYSWSSWAVTSCEVVSSPGAYGFSPWVDWETGYYAVLAMESDEAGAGSGFSAPLMEAVRVELEGLLGP